MKWNQNVIILTEFTVEDFISLNDAFSGVTVNLYFVVKLLIHSHVRVSRHILNHCLLTVEKFASHPVIIFLIKFHQHYINIDPLTKSNLSSLEKR